MDKPIIFLDFDGVVETIYWEKDNYGTLTLNSLKKYPREYLNNTQAIGWLNELYKKIPYNIVISSTWRIGMNIQQLQDLLERSGFDKKIKIIGTTPILHQKRGKETQKWIDDNHFKGKFIIVDDDNDMCHLSEHLIKTDSLLGFTIYDYQKSLEVLTT